MIFAQHIVRSAHPELLKALAVFGFTFGVSAFALAVLLTRGGRK